MRYHNIALAVAISPVVLLVSCTRAVREPRLISPADIPSAASASGPLKAHMHSGDLVVLQEWTETDSALVGRGSRYGPDRTATHMGRIEFVLPFDSIALLEIEVHAGRRTTGVTGIAVWTVLYGIVTVRCVADPKGCFGSCPTFYVATDSGEALAAEGFSGSIARALEARDLDALYPAKSAGGPFSVVMRNEALETHAIRGLRLLAVPRPQGGRVLAAPDDRLYAARALTEPVRCVSPEGDCLAPLRALDGAERTSLADSGDLATTETLELEFPAARGALGLVLAARQSLLSTYLFYQTMGFLGRQAGEALAALERGGRDVAARAMGMARLVGTIRLDVWDGTTWTPLGTHEEAGPLARQITVFPFVHEAGGPIRVRLTAPKGAWRLDWAALAALDGPVEPLTLEPITISGDGVPDSVALALLRDPARHLVTYPGDTYRITFDLPATDGEWELLLESEGYYYEWMRAEWLADEDPGLAALALGDPAHALRVLAPAFKRAEADMELRFWNSRFRR
ncbi:MAG TPA: hypothetical protein VNL18_07650 [Gemmatimonadales bacterium]|nr:hypothetical protein [Gemmatimonadales bacterium]